jgi:ABC-type molybdate transport system substrate-binding protein
MAMPRKAMILMAVMLALATAATAATAFAGTRKKHFDVSKQVVEAIHVASDASLRARLKPLKMRDFRPIAGFKVPTRR